MRVEFIFELLRSKTARTHPWYWHCRASNKEIRCHSEGYTTKASCYNGIKAFTKSMKPGVWRIDETWCENPRRRSKRKAYKRQ